MSSEERKQILKMIESGKISPEEGVSLLEALEDVTVEEGEPLDAGSTSRIESHARLGEIAAKVRSYSYIPMWIGVGFTVLGGLIMYWAMQASGFNFWFYCAWLPFLLGILIISLVAGGNNSRWLFVHVNKSPDSDNGNISLGFPLPFGLGTWGLRTFGHFIPGLDEISIGALLKVLDESSSGEPQLVVDVHDDEDGEHVQVFVA